MTGWKGTPGPWRVGGTGIFPSIMDAQGFAISATGMSKRNLAECKANAKGMAAVPQLVEACEATLLRAVNVHGTCNLCGGQDGDHATSCAVRQLEAALRAAEVLA